MVLTATGVNLAQANTTVAAGQTLSGLEVTPGSDLNVLTGGSASFTLIDNGGTENVQGMDGSATIFGIQNVTPGGVALNGNVSNGGTQTVYEGSWAASTNVNPGGTQNVAGATSNTVVGGGVQNVYSGGAVSTTTVNSGGVQNVAGSANNTVIQVGTQNVYAGAVVTTTTVSAGGIQNVGGRASTTTVDQGTQNVYAGAVVSTTNVNAGGTQNVGGSAVNTLLNTGTQNVYAGAVVFTTNVSAGGTQNVGGSAVNTVLDAGTQNVSNGGVASITNVTNGGVQNVASGGMAVGNVIYGNGRQNVAGTAVSTTVSQGQQIVNNGGRVSTTTVVQGQQQILGGAVAFDTTLNGNGGQSVSSGGYAQGTTINSGGSATVLDGAVADITTVSSGGIQEVKGGVVSHTTVLMGGWLNVQSGQASSATVEGQASVAQGSLLGAQVQRGGTTVEYNGGVAQGTVLNPGAMDIVSAGGSTVGTLVMKSAWQTVSSGGSASGTVVAGQSGQTVMSGAMAWSTVLGPGARQNVQAGGSAWATKATSASVTVDGTLDGVTLTASTLGGAGTVTSGLTITSGSTLLAMIPGQGLHVNGDLVLNDGGRYATVLSPDGGAGLITVQGNVTIANGTALTLTALNGAYAPGAVYEVIAYTGVEKGTFSTVSSDLAYLTPTVSYDNGGVSVALTPLSTFNQTGFLLPGASQNASDVAMALNRIERQGGNAVTKALLTASSDQALAGLTALAGDELAIVRSIAETRTSQAQEMVADRLSAMAVPGVLKGQGLTSSPDHEVWAQGGLEQTTTQGSAALGASSWKDDSVSLAFGMDARTSVNTRVGAMMMINNDTVSFGEREGVRLRTNGIQAVLYGAFLPHDRGVYAMGSVALGDWDNRSTRHANVVGLNGQPEGSVNSFGEAIYGEAGLTVPMGPWTVQPFVGARMGHYTQQGLDETSGGPLDLQVHRASTTALHSVLGLHAIGHTQWKNHAMNLHATVAWEHRLNGNDESIQVALASNPNEQWLTFATPQPRDVAHLTLGVTYAVTPRTTAYLNLSGEMGQHTHDYGGQAGLRWAW